jgi:hypothetical protein
VPFFHFHTLAGPVARAGAQARRAAGGPGRGGQPGGQGAGSGGADRIQPVAIRPADPAMGEGEVVVPVAAQALLPGVADGVRVRAERAGKTLLEVPPVTTITPLSRNRFRGAPGKPRYSASKSAFRENTPTSRYRN